MAVTPFNASLSNALVYARPQLPTLTTTTVPTAAQATLIWNQAWGKVATHLRMAGVGLTFTADSSSEQWVWMVEGKLTSGLVLLEKGSRGTKPMGVSGSGGDSTADRLIASADAELEKLKDRAFRLAIIGGGGSSASLPASGFASSDFTDWRDTSVDVTPGGDNVLYVPSIPVMQDGESL